MPQEMTPEASFTLLEEEVRRFWRRHCVPDTFRAKVRGGTPRAIALQPLMAAGSLPGEQVGLLATADLIVRYQAMRGWPARRRTGWICHGLPVELAVERTLDPALSGYDVSTFSAACREAAIEGVEKGEALAERLAVWPGADDVFISLERQAVGTVWGALRRLWDDGKLKRERCVVSVCSRCATPLSFSEAARRTVEVEARSAWVRLPLDGEPDTYLLVWTPMPWMLVGMVAVAANPEAEYVVIELPARELLAPDPASARSGRLLVAETALKRAISGDYGVVKRLSGRSLRGTHYLPPFTFLAAGSGVAQVVLSDQVPLDQGAGLWPVTPAFDAPSLAVAERHGLPVPELLDDWGAFDDAVTRWRGLSPLDAEPLLIEDLKARGLLFDEDKGRSRRALCPHCATALLPLARSVWTVEMPDESWVVSRDRVWGVPLPVWTCAQCGDVQCVAGLDDLARRTALDVSQIDPHRPAVDRLVFPCEKCGGMMRRAGAVLDASLESALLSNTHLSQPGPASLAIGVGNERLGWLDDFARVAALLRNDPAWEQALAIPASEPEAAWDLERHAPADALRWAAYAGTTPEQAERSFLRPLWQLAFTLLDAPEGQDLLPRDATDELLDRWATARIYQTTAIVTQALDDREPQQAAGTLAALMEDLAGWYVPRRPGAGARLLEPLTLLLAPFVPYLAEAVHRRLGTKSGASVHLEDWPTLDPAWEDEALLSHMARVRHLAELGLRARAEAGIAPHRVLPGALAGSLEGAAWALADLQPFIHLLADALAVAQVKLSPGAGEYIGWRLALAPERAVQREVPRAAIEAALAELGADESAYLAEQLRQGMSVGLEVAGLSITLLPDEVSVSVQPRSGWAAAADAEHLVALVVG